MDDFRPALEVVTPTEQRAMQIAVTYALRCGVATDDLDGPSPSNRSLVSLGRKLGCTIPDWYDDEDPHPDWKVGDGHLDPENPGH